MQVMRTGPASVMFTLDGVSNADDTLLRETARAAMQAQGITPAGALELETFSNGQCAVVFARYEENEFLDALYRFDSPADLIDAARSCEGRIPSRLYRLNGWFYIALPEAFSDIVCEYAQPAEPQEVVQVLCTAKVVLEHDALYRMRAK